MSEHVGRKTPLGWLAGGILLGLGLGMTGTCPGTGLATAAACHLDAVVTVAGMRFGALSRARGGGVA